MPDARQQAVEQKQERVFDEPWQAQLFALTVKLSEAGHFAWTEWTERFGAELKHDRPYYDTWLVTLEKLLVERGLASPAALADLKHAWTDAYRATPHGQPVELKR
jgi:nitrile hydratase accessory protein